MFINHITGIDIFTRALIVANDILEKSDYISLRQKRYASFVSGENKAFEKGELGLAELRKIAERNVEPAIISGAQEYFESLINQYL